MDVAQRLGVTQQTVSVLERNAEAVSAQRLTQLMNILGVEVVLRRKSEVSTEVDKSSGNDTEW